MRMLEREFMLTLRSEYDYVLFNCKITIRVYMYVSRYI